MAIRHAACILIFIWWCSKSNIFNNHAATYFFFFSFQSLSCVYVTHLVPNLLEKIMSTSLFRSSGKLLQSPEKEEKKKKRFPETNCVSCNIFAARTQKFMCKQFINFPIINVWFVGVSRCWYCMLHTPYVCVSVGFTGFHLKLLQKIWQNVSHLKCLFCCRR